MHLPHRRRNATVRELITDLLGLPDLDAPVLFTDSGADPSHLFQLSFDGFSKDELMDSGREFTLFVCEGVVCISDTIPRDAS